MRHMLYEGVSLERVFRHYADAKEYIETMYPNGRLDKDGDWKVNGPGEETWFSFHEVDVHELERNA